MPLILCRFFPLPAGDRLSLPFQLLERMEKAV